MRTRFTIVAVALILVCAVTLHAVATGGQVLISSPRVQWEYLDDISIVEWFQYQIDKAPPIQVGLPPPILTAPLTYEAPFSDAGLTDGGHTVSVSACNSIGCSDPSLATATFAVTSTPPPPPPLVCPAAAVGEFTGCYYTGASFDALTLVRTDAGIAFNWGSSAPDPGLPVDGFSVRWTGIFAFEAGTYTFTDQSDDGIRVFLDDALILDRWIDRPVTSDSTPVPVTAGSHTVRVEYYENGGDAEVAVNWALSAPPLLAVNCVVSDWSCSAWSACDASGSQSRTCTRSIVTPPANGGLACPALTSAETQACSPPPPPGDTVAPTAALTVGQNGKSKNYTFIARASDNVGVVRVELALDGRAPAPMTLQVNGTWTAQIAITSAGLHTATATAYDAAKNPSLPAVVRFTR